MWPRSRVGALCSAPAVNGTSPTSFGCDPVWTNAAVTPNVVQGIPLPNLPPRTNAAEKTSVQMRTLTREGAEVTLLVP